MSEPAEHMNVTLPKELEQFVRDQVRHGAYASSGDYVRTLIRERYLLERDRTAKREALNDALERGLADADAERVVPLKEAFDRLRVDLDLPPSKARE